MNSAAYPLNLSQQESVVSLRSTTGQGVTPTILDLMEDGIYLLFLLHSGNFPVGEAAFNERIDQFLTTFDRVCATFGKSSTHVNDAKYAFCALLDEILLSPSSPLREEWQQSPLQLRLFGEHLAGEGFFDRLTRLRVDVAENIEIIELFHTCMLLGFRGKYVLEGLEKLSHLIGRVGQEVASVRGKGQGIAPNWKLPFRLTEYVGKVLPLWFYGAVVVLLCLMAFLTFDWMLDRKLDQFPSAEPLPSGVLVVEKPEKSQ